MGIGKGHVCSFIIEVSSRGAAACVQCTRNSPDLRHRWLVVSIKIQPLFCRESRKTFIVGLQKGEKVKMKIHPLSSMDPDENPPCSGQYHQGHLPTRWILYIPDCPGPMVIQNIFGSGGKSFWTSVLVFNLCHALVFLHAVVRV